MIRFLESLSSWGGVKRDVVFLLLSGLALAVSLIDPALFPIHPAWAAILLCGVPILLEAVIGLVTAFDIKADVLVSIALIASVAIGSSCSWVACWRSSPWPGPGQASSGWSASRPAPPGG